MKYQISYDIAIIAVVAIITNSIIIMKWNGKGFLFFSQGTALHVISPVVTSLITVL